MFDLLRVTVSMCTKCGRLPRRAPGQRWCDECHARYSRQQRASRRAARLARNLRA